MIDGQGVYKFNCRPDTLNSLCPPPADLVPIDPALTAPGEHAISIKVAGSEQAFLYVSVERAGWADPDSGTTRP